MKIRFPQLRSKRQSQFATCDICLIVYNHVLLHANTQNLVAQHDESIFQFTATELANVARRLLPLATTQQRIALALPSHEFVATSLKLPTIDAQNLKNAVSLQLPTLLPGITEPLLLAVQAQTPGEQTYALWLAVKRAEELFREFEKVGLFLACLLPRPLITLPKNHMACQVYDEDDNTITYMEWSGNAIQRWLHLPKADRDVTPFQQQLEEAMSGFTSHLEQEWKTNINDWEEIPMPPTVVYSYAFVPPSAVLAAVQAAKQRRRKWLSIAAGIFGVGVIIGISWAIAYEQHLKQRLAEQKHRTDNVSQWRAEVSQFEDTFGPVKNFPHQDVVKILQILDELIPKDSWIVSFQIEGGVIKLEGYSLEPTKLIETLTKQPEFYDVHQSRGTTQEPNRKELRFGIDLKLKDFDLATYWLEYFPNKK
jgi:hypothetical protein